MVTLGGTPLEELVDQGLGMMEEETGPMGRASHRGSFHSDSLLAPDTDFMTGEWPWVRRWGRSDQRPSLVTKPTRTGLGKAKMEGGKACPHPGAREGGRSERLCTREERTRRRNPSGAVVSEGAGAGPGRKRSSTSSPPLPSCFFSHHDDRSSAASGLDVVDRLTYLEQRMQMQEDEIQLLKMTLADVLKRLNVSEEHQASTSSSGGRRIPGAKDSAITPPSAESDTSCNGLKSLFVSMAVRHSMVAGGWAGLLVPTALSALLTDRCPDRPLS
ncbi:unnamed protein product [Boreogadus saida]